MGRFADFACARASQELRPQDSIPFIRRISSEQRRPELHMMGVPETSPLAQDLTFFSSSPMSTGSPLFPDVASRNSREFPSRDQSGAYGVRLSSSWFALGIAHTFVLFLFLCSLLRSTFRSLVGRRTIVMGATITVGLTRSSRLRSAKVGLPSLLFPTSS